MKKRNTRDNYGLGATDRSVEAIPDMPGGIFPVVAPGRREVSIDWLRRELKNHAYGVPTEEIQAAIDHLMSGRFSARAQYEGDGHVVTFG